MASKKQSKSTAHPKKEFKKELQDKMESALPEIKATLGEKKFQRRIKKATKILVHGLHGKDFAGQNGNANATKNAGKKAKAVKKTRPQSQEETSA